MLRHCLVAAGITVAFFPAAAFAQDLTGSSDQDVRQPFTGPRAEVFVGTNGDLLYGGAVGFDLQIRNLVLGVEGEASDSAAKDCFVGVFASEDRFCSITGRDLYVGGRVGVVVTPTTLLYGKIGYTNQRNTTDYIAGSPPLFGSFRASQNVDGIRVGVGLEQKLGRNAYVKGEYRYSDYETGRHNHAGVAGIGFRF